MRREFICRRCGTANRPTAENCAYCGLQIGWRPSLPDTIRFWRWPAPIRETVGPCTASLAVTTAATVPAAWASVLITIPLLVVSAAVLFLNVLAEPPERESRE